MTNEFMLNVAKTIWNQIKASVESMWVLYSWGVSKKVYREYNGMATLALRVTGLLHKGWVYISYNEGKDLYEVRLMTTRHTLKNGTKVYEEVYGEDLGGLIDSIVERGNCSEDEYYKKAMKDSERKMAV